GGRPGGCVDLARPVGIGGVVRRPPLLPGDPGAARGAPFRHGDLLSRGAWHIAGGAGAVAGRPAHHSAASTAERIAADLRVLHDLRPAHHAGLAARPLHLRRVGGGPRPLAHLLHADAAGALCGADRPIPLPPPSPQNSSPPAVPLDPPRPNSIP